MWYFFFPLIFGLISCPISFWLLLWCYWTSVLTWCRRREWWVVKRNLDHVTFELVVSHNLVDVHNKARMPNLPGNRLPATHLLLRSKILFSSLKWKCEGNQHIVLKITKKSHSTLRTLFENYSKCLIWIFQFGHSLPIFVPIKLTCLVKLFDGKLWVFKS